jgi:hypothetical protein
VQRSIWPTTTTTIYNVYYNATAAILHCHTIPPPTPVPISISPGCANISLVARHQSRNCARPTRQLATLTSAPLTASCKQSEAVEAVMASTYRHTDHMGYLPASESNSDSESPISPFRTSAFLRRDLLAMKMDMLSNTRQQECGDAPTQDNCDGKHDEVDPISISSTTRVAGQTVAPFLAKHIPGQYAPLGAQETMNTQKNPNTKYCYRHRPDLKCRRTADEPSMENLQRVSTGIK